MLSTIPRFQKPQLSCVTKLPCRMASVCLVKGHKSGLTTLLKKKNPSAQHFMQINICVKFDGFLSNTLTDVAATGFSEHKLHDKRPMDKSSKSTCP